MTDDLRTRIIAALLSEDDVALMADAVIRELGLKRESRKRSYGVAPNQPGVIDRDCHRYVTAWEWDD